VELGELGRGSESLIALNNLIDRFGDDRGDEIEHVMGLARDFRDQLLEGDDD
jgi:hypothetical protein